MPPFVEFDVTIHGKENREDVGKAHAAPQASAERCAVAELHAHDVFEGGFHRTAGIGGEAWMLLHLAQGDHGANAKFLVGFFDLVETQIAQIDGGAEGGCPFSSTWCRPRCGCVFLVELPGFVEGLRALVFFWKVIMFLAPLLEVGIVAHIILWPAINSQIQPVQPSNLQRRIPLCHTLPTTAH